MQEELVSMVEAQTSGPAVPPGGGLRADENEVDLFEIMKVLRSKRFFILKCALIPALLMIVAVLILRPTYTAETTFLPPNSLTSNSTSALLGQIGALGAAGGALGGLKDPTLIYVSMLSSRSIADELIRRFDLGKVYRTKRLSQTESALKSHTKIVSGKDSMISVSVDDHDPQRSADMANEYLIALHRLNDRIAFTEAGQKRIFFEQQLEKEKNLLADAEVELARSQQQTGLILPTGQAQLAMTTIAQTQAEIAVREVQLAAMSQAATEQNPDVIRIRSEVAGLKSQLNKLENSSKEHHEGSVELPTAKVPELTLIYVRKARDVKFHEALYELLLRQYETAKLDEARSAPLIQVVDYASAPDTKSGPKRTLLTLLALAVGGFAGSAWVLMRYAVRNKNAGMPA